jgi:hypothetical protein
MLAVLRRCDRLIAAKAMVTRRENFQTHFHPSHISVLEWCLHKHSNPFYFPKNGIIFEIIRLVMIFQCVGVVAIHCHQMHVICFQVEPNFEKACKALREHAGDNEAVEYDNFLTVYIPMKRNLIRAFDATLNVSA